MNNIHIINAARYISAVYGIQINESADQTELLKALRKALIITNDLTLDGYLHEYDLETSEKYRNNYLSEKNEITVNENSIYQDSNLLKYK